MCVSVCADCAGQVVSVRWDAVKRRECDVGWQWVVAVTTPTQKPVKEDEEAVWASESSSTATWLLLDTSELTRNMPRGLSA